MRELGEGVRARTGGAVSGGFVPARLRDRVVDAVLGTDTRRRIRTGQCVFSLWVYAASAFVLWFNMRQ